jgi:hypothetical protein
MEIDWVTVDDDEDEDQEFNGAVSSEAPFWGDRVCWKDKAHALARKLYFISRQCLFHLPCSSLFEFPLVDSLLALLFTSLWNCP